MCDAQPGSPEGDQVEVLSTLLEAYEAKHHPIPAPDPIAAIEFMMEQKGFTRRDLEPVIGSRGRVSEILNRKRPLTLPMVRALSALLQIPVEVLVQPYETQSAARDDYYRVLTGGTSRGISRLQPVVVLISSTVTPGAISRSAMPSGVISNSP